MKNKIGAGLLVLLVKVGPKVVSILAKSSKFLLVGVSFAAYAYVYTWQFSVIILSMLIVHEYGHIWAMQRCGIKTKGIYLIPFVGGLALGAGMAKSRWDEVFIAMMGPVFGLVLSLVSMIIYYITSNPLFAATASWMAMVNALNLFPITPLDGGRVLKAVTLSINNTMGLIYMSGALLLLLAAVLFLGMWTFLILIIIGGLELYFEYSKTKTQNVLKDFQARKHQYSESDAKAIDELVERHVDKTEPMDRVLRVRSMLWYVLTLALLYVIMELMSHEPGAAMAMEVLR